MNAMACRFGTHALDRLAIERGNFPSVEAITLSGRHVLGEETAGAKGGRRGEGISVIA